MVKNIGANTAKNCEQTDAQMDRLTQFDGTLVLCTAPKQVITLNKAVNKNINGQLMF